MKRQFSSVRWRIVIAYLLIICGAFYVVATSLLPLVSEYLFNQRVTEDRRFTEQIAIEMAAHMKRADAEGMYELSRRKSREGGGRVLVLDAYGVVQCDSYAALSGQRMDQREVRLVLAGETNAHGFYRVANEGARGQERDFRARLREYRSGGRTLLGQYASAIVYDGELRGALLYVVNAQDMYSSLMDLQDSMLLWFVATAVAVSLLSLFLSRLITKPIEELNEGILWIGRGDFSHRVKIGGYSEFAQLANAFNMMCERLNSLDKLRNQFVSNASHELKTPLATIKILLETLLYQEKYDPELQKEFLKDINREIDRLNYVISDLLALVSIDSGEMRLKLAVVSLSELIFDTVRRLSPLARDKEIELVTSVSAQADITIEADRMRLQQAIYNLIDNAIKYTPRGGRVRVQLTKEERNALIRVSDTGIGIPREDILHVFDRFYRVDKARSRETGGTGLGLSIVKQIVLLHGGSVSVESEEDKGSVFTVSLPL